jgi:hypothetical protein
VRLILDRIDTLDRERWAAAFCAAGEPHYQAGLAAETKGNGETARRGYLAAFELFRVAARYLAPTSPTKLAAYRRSQDAYIKLAAFTKPAVQRVTIPYVASTTPNMKKMPNYVASFERWRAAAPSERAQVIRDTLHVSGPDLERAGLETIMLNGKPLGECLREDLLAFTTWDAREPRR